MLMPNFYSQFVVNPTAALSIQYLPGTEIAEEKKKGGGRYLKTQQTNSSV